MAMAIALLGVLWPMRLLAIAHFALCGLLFTEIFVVFVSIKKSLPDERYSDWQRLVPVLVTHNKRYHFCLDLVMLYLRWLVDRFAPRFAGLCPWTTLYYTYRFPVCGHSTFENVPPPL